jgi:hypothetical protein
MRRLLIVTLVVAAVGFLTVVANANPGDPEVVTFGNNPVHIHNDCEGAAPSTTEWGFVITQVSTNPSGVPPTITVFWSNGTSTVVGLTSVTGDVAHYVTTLHLNDGVIVTDAVAILDSEWEGNFNLSHGPCGPPPTTTTSTVASTTTTSPPTPTPFAIEVTPVCPDGTAPLIAITFGNRPDLDGQTGTLTFSTGGSVPLTFQSNTTTEIPYPASAGTGPVTMTYTLGQESVTRTTTFPEACTEATTTTTSASTTTTSTSTTTTTTTPHLPPPNPPQPAFTFGAAATVCIREVPTIEIVFQNTFPELAGHVGTLTMTALNGTVVSTQQLAYVPGTTVHLLYPGTAVNPDGTIDDVPGWILTDDGFWIRDPSDEFLRDGIVLSYSVNPTATATVSYPPESSTCANPAGPFPPAEAPPTPLTPGLPHTR